MTENPLNKSAVPSHAFDPSLAFETAPPEHPSQTQHDPPPPPAQHDPPALPAQQDLPPLSPIHQHNPSPRHTIQPEQEQPEPTTQESTNQPTIDIPQLLFDFIQNGQIEIIATADKTVTAEISAVNWSAEIESLFIPPPPIRNRLN